MKKANKGFTLIELLVVIAIIGILSAIILANLGQARNKGSDAAIDSNLNNARAQAELYASNNGQSFAGVCDSAPTDTNPGILGMRVGAQNAGSADVECGDTANGWAMAAQLKTDQTLYYCVDSTGISTTTGLTITPGPGSADTLCE